MKRMKIIFSVLAALFLLVSVGCGSSSTPKADSGKKETKKELIVATEPSFAPFEFPDKKTNEIIGFDIDIINAVAKKAGFEKVTVKSMGFDALIPALNSGNIDATIAGMSITEARKKQVNFTDPYYTSGLWTIVAKDNTTIKSMKDLEGKTIGVQLGTVGAEAAGKIKGATVKTFNTSDLACLELKNKGVDAVISDAPVLAYFLKTQGASYAKGVGEAKKDDSYGIATAKKNKELADKLNKALGEIKKNGEYQKIYDKWFKTEK